MTHAADSAARQVTHGESERELPATEVGDIRLGASSHLPVFAALGELGLTGRDVAEFAGVTPPTVSKWRSGKVRIPGDRLAFVTLVLAHLLDDAQEMEAKGPAGVEQDDWKARLDSAKAYLVYQDVLNRELAAGDVREGAQMFRVWWSSSAAKKLQDKRFCSEDCNADGK
jgi:transcriptional regulator with XRE-family HTH domain